LIVIGSSDLAMMDTLGIVLVEHDGWDGLFGSCHTPVAAP
jgi:hypothetical protein